MSDKNKIRVAVSGYFDPIHVGHLDYLRMAKELGDSLVVIVNNNYQCKLKKGKHFMDENDRVEIVKALRFVDEVFFSCITTTTGRHCADININIMQHFKNCQNMYKLQTALHTLHTLHLYKSVFSKA